MHSFEEYACAAEIKALPNRLWLRRTWRSRCEIYNNVNGGVRRETGGDVIPCRGCIPIFGGVFLWPALPQSQEVCGGLQKFSIVHRLRYDS